MRATGRPRSVIVTVSPPAAAVTTLDAFCFRARIPTSDMFYIVAHIRMGWARDRQEGGTANRLPLGLSSLLKRTHVRFGGRTFTRFPHRHDRLVRSGRMNAAKGRQQVRPRGRSWTSVSSQASDLAAPLREALIPVPGQHLGTCAICHRSVGGTWRTCYPLLEIADHREP